MKKYVYFVSLIYCEGTNIRYGNTESHISHRITGMKDIELLAERVKEVAGMKHNPTIMNYKLLRVEEEGGSDA